MKVCVFMPVLNEADILPWTVRHMISQGLSVHVLDGWSTDGSWEMLPELGATRERFPADGPCEFQVCRDILARVEALAASSEADWCYLSDADEIRRTQRLGERLVDGIARLDAQGYNVIDHKVYSFWPVDDGYREDPESYFRFCTDKAELLCRLPQQKCWKNVGAVNLTNTGGHAVDFPGKHVAPEKFILKHYPYRTQAQSRMRIKTRLERRCKAEHRAGWGVHYDGLSESSDFIRKPDDKTLMFWRDIRKPFP